METILTIVFRAAILAVAALVGTDVLPGPRVRSSHPYIRAMIAEAQVRSATFRALVAAVESTDGIVYVEEGECPYKVRACLPPFIASAGAFRFLRILVDARLEDWQVMSDIGHELQHALEVLRDPTARTNANLFFLVFKSSFVTKNIYETQDAISVGEAVKKEVKAFAGDRSTKGRSR
jgi:hypothetical protein